MSERQLKILVRTIDISNSPASLEENLKGMVNLISEEFGINNCRVYAMDADGSTLSIKAVNEKGYAGEEVSMYKIGNGLIGSCALKKEPIMVEDISAASISELSLLDEADRYASFAAFPLADDRTTYGVLYLSSERP
ncbi:MAG: GAF domain-containing protein, partial [Deltaproteobacteria bacterium]